MTSSAQRSSCSLVRPTAQTKTSWHCALEQSIPARGLSPLRTQTSTRWRRGGRLGCRREYSPVRTERVCQEPKTIPEEILQACDESKRQSIHLDHTES